MSDDIQVGFDFDKQFDQFDVTGLKTEFDERGGIKSGFQYRWCESNQMNLDRKMKREGYAIDLDPDTQATYGDNTESMGKRIRGYNEEYVLCKRPKEVRDAEREWMNKRKAGAIEQTNTYKGPDAISQFMLKSSKGHTQMNQQRPPKRGR